MNSTKTIAIFGHYGNQNLGDESITQAMLDNMSQRLPEAQFIGMSINPVDTARRHRITSFAIRRRSDGHNGPIEPELADTLSAPSAGAAVPTPAQAQQKTHESISWKKRLKSLPVLGWLLQSCQALLQLTLTTKNEIIFLLAARRAIKNIDLIIVTGSNQFLDNFGGAWGFPYTLLKWTLLAKSCGNKVAFASVGAGPLSLPVSFKMLNLALGKSDFLSYRDDGSKALLESVNINLNGLIYPDIAHSLNYQNTTSPTDGELTIAVNPMPVYDSRYWAVADDLKFHAYVQKVATLCTHILERGCQLKLFTTQARDADVIVDIVNVLQQSPAFDEWQARLQIINDESVNQLMETIASADIIVATRFHATVLPLQLDKPVMGICYYRKAAELLNDVGLQDYHVDIDDFSAEILIQMLESMISNRQQLTDTVSQRYAKYTHALDEQYQQLTALVN